MNVFISYFKISGRTTLGDPPAQQPDPFPGSSPQPAAEISDPYPGPPPPSWQQVNMASIGNHVYDYNVEEDLPEVIVPGNLYMGKILLLLFLKGKNLF